MSEQDHTALGDADYRRVREGTRTYREELVVRLAGECGLRPREMAEISLEDGRVREVDGTVHRVLAVSGREGDRVVPVPDALWDSLAKFARERDRDADEPIFSVSARRIQMLMSEVGDRVDGVSVSSRALRRSFARRALADGVDPRIVQVAGGWASLDTVADLGESPDERAVVRAFSADTPGENSGQPGHGEVIGGFERAVDAALDLGAVLEAAGTRADLERRACEAMTAAGYDAAWVLGTGGEGEEATVRASTGGEEGAAAETLPPAVRTAVTTSGTDRDVERVADGDAVPGLTARHALAAVPVAFGDTAYGSLLVASADEKSFGPRERRVLADVGRRLGQAIASVTRRRLLRDDAVVELSFRSEDERSFLVETARECGCSFALEGLAPVSGESLVLYVRVSGTAPESVVDRAADDAAVTKARLIRTAGESSVVELVLSGASMAVTLTRYGGNVTEYAVDATGASLTAEFPTDVDVRGVVEGVTAAFPDTDFGAKREVAHPVSADGSLSDLLTEELTDKQRSVLRSAYLAGYFDWPRGTTAEELADALGISSPTLHNHLRKAQRTVLDDLFDERPD